MKKFQDFQYHRNTQIAVKSVLDNLPDYIDGRDSEKTIAFVVKRLLEKQRAKFQWHHDIKIYVSSGQDTQRSKDSKYLESGISKIGDCNLINVILKSVDFDCVGDCSRTFIIENATLVSRPQTILFSEGLEMANMLHQEMKDFVTKDTRLHDIFIFSNDLLNKVGYVNLVANNHFGHSVSLAGKPRQYIAVNSDTRISQIDFFSYNIHICRQGGMWGFCVENSYFFNEYGNLEAL